MTTVLVPNRSAALRIGYEATDWSRPISFDDYEKSMADWDVQVIERDGESIGAAYFCDGEVHTSILPKWRRRWATKGLLQKLFGGEVKTKVTPGHTYMYDILERLGFVPLADGTFVKESANGH
jgi:hypothetical protein